MITRFFGTSKPIHLILITTLVIVLFVASRFNTLSIDFEIVKLIREIIVGVVLIFSIGVLDFFVSKNRLTQRNGYTIMFYFLFLAALPATLAYDNLVLANLFILLAMRRLISLRTQRSIKKKLFDAAFWIGLASLFYFWSFLFFALILASYFLFSIENIKNWIIPVLGLFTVAILVVCYSLLTNDSLGQIDGYVDTISYNLSPYNNLKFIIPFTILISLGLWALYFYIVRLKDKPKNLRASHVMVVFSSILSMVIISVAPEKNGSEFIFLFFPLSIIMSNYIQGVHEKWFGEIFVWVIVLLPLTILLI